VEIAEKYPQQVEQLDRQFKEWQQRMAIAESAKKKK
jgi:hypothetical protein